MSPMRDALFSFGLPVDAIAFYDSVLPSPSRFRFRFRLSATYPLPSVADLRPNQMPFRAAWQA
jgi:hypothetical protein